MPDPQRASARRPARRVSSARELTGPVTPRSRRERVARAGARRPVTSPAQNHSGDVAQLLRLGERLQLLQRLVLDLADPLAGDVERAADLVERARVLAAEPVAELEHAALAVGEVLQRLAQRLLGEQVGGALERATRPSRRR